MDSTHGRFEVPVPSDNRNTFGFSNLRIHGFQEELDEVPSERLPPVSWPLPHGYDANHHMHTVPPSFAQPDDYMHPHTAANPAYLHPAHASTSRQYSQSQDHQADRRLVYYVEHAPSFQSQVYAFPQGGDEAAFDSQYLDPSFMPSRAVHSRMNRPLASNHYMACAWGEPCGHFLDDLSASGITRHLKEHHFGAPSKPWSAKNRGSCQWRDADSICFKELNYASFGKHVAAVHLQSTARTCPHCYQSLGRADSLERHVKHYCPRSGRAAKK